MSNSIKQLVNNIQKERPDIDVGIVERAYIFAREKHAGQKRKTGEDYINHPLEVADILVGIGMDTPSIVAAILHDTIEDTTATKEEIADIFGGEIAELVDGVTHLTNLDFSHLPSEEIQEAKYRAMIESLRKFFLAMAKDMRVVIIKLADRLHNMRTLDALSPDDRKRKSRETIEIFAPLADRMGMGKIKAELEDLSFKYIDPVAYKRLKETISKGEQERRRYLHKIKKVITESLDERGVKAEIDGRLKHLYSIYRKLQKVDGDMSKIYDLLAIRVVVDSVEDCYLVLGLIHQHFRPLIYRIKDYIAVPKPNGYQSLHTTVIGIEGVVTEFQIRTLKMHDEAELGVAAHWHYDETKQSLAYQRRASFATKDRMEWVGQLMDWQRNVTDSNEIAESLNIDFFNDRIFVMSPRGDVYDLPKSSTPVDFAYEIHSKIGDKCRGAKVNGKMMGLDHILHNQDIVEIITAAKNDKSGPSRDWLDFVKTAKARQHIRSWFKKLSRDDNIVYGKQQLLTEMALYGLTDSDIESIKEQEIIGNSGWKEWDDVLAAIGDGTVTARQIAKKLVGERIFREFTENQKADKILDKINSDKVVDKFSSIEGVLVRYAECCKPKKGDALLGFITRGKGITIHRADCRNLLTSPPERIIELDIEIENNLSASIVVTAEGRVGLLRDITQVLASLNINIERHEQKKNENEESVITMKLSTDSPDSLVEAIDKTSRITGVLSVKQS